MSNESSSIGETALTVGGSIFGSLFSHVFCCGLLPLALNASASAILNSLGMQIGFAIATTVAVASGVTFFEKHHHNTACKSTHVCGCTTTFNLRKHFLRNLATGAVVYSLFYIITHLPGIHAVLERNFGI